MLVANMKLFPSALNAQENEVHEEASNNQEFGESSQDRYDGVQEAPIIQENNGFSLPWTQEVQEESFVFQESGGVGLTNTQEMSDFLEDIPGEVTKVLVPKVLGLGLTWLDKRQSKAQLAATKKYNGVMCSRNTELLFQENASSRNSHLKKLLSQQTFISTNFYQDLYYSRNFIKTLHSSITSIITKMRQTL